MKKIIPIIAVLIVLGAIVLSAGCISTNTPTDTTPQQNPVIIHYKDNKLIDYYQNQLNEQKKPKTMVGTWKLSVFTDMYDLSIDITDETTCNIVMVVNDDTTFKEMGFKKGDIISYENSRLEKTADNKYNIIVTQCELKRNGAVYIQAKYTKSEEVELGQIEYNSKTDTIYYGMDGTSVGLDRAN